MINIGLTGPTGAGKGEVARIFEENGCLWIDTDALSRQAVEPHSPCLALLVEAFSDAILCDDGTLDRKELAKRAFSSPKQTAKLNAIVHPEVIRLTQIQLREAQDRGIHTAIIDAPLLFEAKMDTICHGTVAVIASDERRFARICARDGLTDDQALARMNAQPPLDYYTERADKVIENDGDLASLRAQVQRLFDTRKEWCRAD